MCLVDMRTFSHSDSMQASAALSRLSLVNDSPGIRISIDFLITLYRIVQPSFSTSMRVFSSVHSGCPSSFKCTNPPVPRTLALTHPRMVAISIFTPSVRPLVWIAPASCSRSTSDSVPLFAALAAIFSCKSLGSLVSSISFNSSVIT